jgi:hypothetical protein
MTERRLGLWWAIGIITALTLMPVSAGAAQQRAEPALLNLGWWWEEAETQEHDIQGNKVVVGTTNPFCPAAPSSLGAVPGTCAEGSLPVEIVGGDYETPNKLSALGFDLSYVTSVPGAEVISFTVKLLESEAGCYDRGGDGEIQPGPTGSDGDYCQQTNPTNIDGKKVQACELTQIFGDAEASPYKEVPSYECTPNDPVAERKEIKAVDEGDTDGIDHVWTFDLTEYAQQWAEDLNAAANVMLVGQAPKEEGGPQDSWRVIFAGPKVEKGIVTELVYEPGEISIPPIAPPPGSDPGIDTGGFPSTGDPGDFGSSGLPPGAAPPPGAPAPGASPSAAPGEVLAGDETSEEASLPPYVWMALLGGLIAFALVRQVVIESTTGIRPNGVLAKIHALNADKRGAPVGAVGDGPSPLSGVGAVFGAIGRGAHSLIDKLPFGRKG